MSVHQVHVFISHSWKYSGHYDTLSKWIFEGNWKYGQASVDFRDYSVPSAFPIVDANNTRQLKDSIYNKIARSHVVVIPTGMYANYSTWISKEIEGAKSHSKPILAVDLRGAQRTSSVVGSAANKCVAWNSRSVANGIWQLYYHG